MCDIDYKAPEQDEDGEKLRNYRKMVNTLKEDKVTLTIIMDCGGDFTANYSLYDTHSGYTSMCSFKATCLENLISKLYKHHLIFKDKDSSE